MRVTSRLKTRITNNTMPFQSKAQMRAAFGGYLGAEMKAKAKEFAHATPSIAALPGHVKKRKGPVIPDTRKIKRA
jgi:hypothetical protein